MHRSCARSKSLLHSRLLMPKHRHTTSIARERGSNKTNRRRDKHGSSMDSKRQALPSKTFQTPVFPHCSMPSMAPLRLASMHNSHLNRSLNSIKTRYLGLRAMPVGTTRVILSDEPKSIILICRIAMNTETSYSKHLSPKNEAYARSETST